MIRIKGIEIKDFGRHKHIKQNLGGNIIGLTGANGLGKSTVIQAIQYALTGTIDHTDPLREFIRKCADKPPKNAQVILDFEADGKAGRITRKITKTTTSRKLEFEGEKTKTSDREVTNFMSEILGVDKQAINSTVFLAQGELDHMFGGDVDRRKFYTKLLMLGEMEKTGKVVNNTRKHLSEATSDLAPQRDSAEASQREATQHYQNCARELSELPCPKEALKSVRNLEALFGRVDIAAYKLERAKAEVDEGGDDLQQSVEKIKTEIDSIDTKVLNLEEDRDRSELLSEKVIKNKTARDKILRFNNLKTKQEAEQAEHDALLARLPADVSVEIEEAKNALMMVRENLESTQDIAKFTAKLEPAKEQLKVVTDSLPGLKSVRDDLATTFAEARNEVRMRQSLIDGMQHSHADGESCPLCGQGETVDIEYVTSTQQKWQAIMDDAQGKGSEASDKLRKAETDKSNLEVEVHDIETKLQAAKDKRNKTHVGLLNNQHNGKSVDELLSHIADRENLQQKHKEISEKVKQRKWSLDQVTLEINNPEFSEYREHGTPPTAELDGSIKEDEEKSSTLWNEERKTELSRLREQRSVLSDKLTRLGKAASNYEQADADYKELNKQLKEAVGDITRDTLRLADDFDGAITSHVVTDALQKLELEQEAYQSAKGRVESAETSMAAANARVLELETRIEENKHRLNLIDELGKVVSAFSPDGASLEFINHKFDRIAALTADYLAQTGSDFMVTSSDSVPLSFDFLRTDHPNEVWLPQTRLSGGQRIRLAVAALRAIHDLVIPNVGFMSLDEPTTHLDVEAQQQTAEMFRSISAEGVTQMLICDHSPLLENAFDETIRISE